MVTYLSITYQKPIVSYVITCTMLLNKNHIGALTITIRQVTHAIKYFNRFVDPCKAGRITCNNQHVTNIIMLCYNVFK